jgi:PIN domain nuclease of toxin-antitoxin system
VEAARIALTVLDASAVIGFLRDEPARNQVEELLRRRPPPVISAVNLCEVIDVLVSVGGQSEEAVNDAIDLLIVGGLEVEPFWLPHGRLAASIRSAHYHRRRSSISLGDAACLATARSLKATVATTDVALADVARELGLEASTLPV